MSSEQSNDIEQKVLCAIHNLEPTTHDEIVSETHIPRDDVKTAIVDLADKGKVTTTVDWQYVSTTTDREGVL